MSVTAPAPRPAQSTTSTAPADGAAPATGTTGGSTPASSTTAGAAPAEDPARFEGSTAEREQREAAVGNTARPAEPESRESIARRMEFLTDEQRRTSLKQAGVQDDWLNASTEQQRKDALVSVEEARQRGGAVDLELPTARVENPGISTESEYVPPSTTEVPGRATFHADAQGRVAADASAPHADLASTDILRAQAQADAQPWPGGKPEDRIKPRFEPGNDGNSVADTATRQTKIDTVLAAMPESQRAEAQALIDGKGEPDATGARPLGVTDESLDRAFNTVLEARKTPGEKPLDISLTPVREVQDWGDNGGVRREEGAARTFSSTVNVNAEGHVNGKPLPADLRARLSSEVKTVPQEFKDQQLKEAGLSDTWMSQASPLQKDEALARIREASMTPGQKELDLGFSTQVYSGGEGGDYAPMPVDGKIRLDVAADGKINGKTPTIEKALATQLQMEALPMAEKRALMGSLGFDAEAQRNVRPDQAASLLTRAAMATEKGPGEHRIDVEVGGDKYALALKVGADGKLEGAGTAKIPPPKKKKWYQKILQPILTIASIIPSPIQPFAAIANGVIGGVQSLRNGNILGAVASFAGAGGAVAGLAGNVGLASTLSNVGAAAGAAGGAIQAIRTGDVAGLFSSVVSGANAIGTLAGTPLSSDLTRLGTVVSTASAVARGDALGALGGVVSLAESFRPREPASATEPPAEGAGSSATAAPEGAGVPADGAGAGVTAAQDPAGAGVDARAPVDGAGGAVGADGEFVGPPAPTTRRVGSGDSLSRIAQETLGDANRWPEIYELNRDVIGNDPNRIRAGTELRIPPPESSGISAARANELHRQAHIPQTNGVSAAANGQVPAGTLMVAADGTIRVSTGAGSGTATAAGNTQTAGQAVLGEVGPQLPVLGSLLGLPSGGLDVIGQAARGGPITVAGAVDALDTELRATRAAVDAAWRAQDIGEAGRLTARANELGSSLNTLRAINALNVGGQALGIVGNVYNAATSQTQSSTAGRVANATATSAADLAIAARANPVFAVIDGAIRVLDPVAQSALGLGENGSMTLSQRISPTVQLGGAINNITGWVDAVWNGDTAALEALRQANLRGQNGVVFMAAGQAGEALASFFWSSGPGR